MLSDKPVEEGGAITEAGTHSDAAEFSSESGKDEFTFVMLCADSRLEFP
jgi:hypothetical protein